MQRSTAGLLGLAFIAALVGIILISHGSAKKRPAAPEAKAVASSSASASPTSSAATVDGGAESDAATEGFTEGFEAFPDGGKVPELPNSAPAEVGFGVVQFVYAGSQFAPADARTKAQARDKAEAVLDLAQHDFAAAVRKGDHGSTADAGRIPRGVLEPPVEYILFTLDKGSVSPKLIDTPRGYWIVRRND